MRSLSVALPRLIDEMVSREGVSLRIDNPEKYHFDKNRLLSLLVQVVLLWSQDQQFIISMNEEKTLDINMFKRVNRICHRLNLLESMKLQALQEFVNKIEKDQSELNKMNEVVDEAPEEYYCSLTDVLMTDPVRLPNSGMIVDRASIEKHLMRTETDPYDRTPLTKDMLIPCNLILYWNDCIGDDLRKEIENWKREHNYPL